MLDIKSMLPQNVRVTGEGGFKQFYWSGRGETNRQDLEYQLAKYGYPISWAPKRQTAKHYLGETMNKLRSTYAVKNERGEKLSRVTRTYTTRWFVGSVEFSVDDDRFGSKDCMVTLRRTGQLEFDGNPATAKAIQDEYDRTIQNEVFSNQVMQNWLKDIMKSRFNAHRAGPNYIVSPTHAEEAERFLTGVSEIWGTDWLLPGLEYVDNDQFKECLTRSLVNDITERLQKVADNAGTRAIDSFVDDLYKIVEEAKKAQSAIGSDNLRVVLKTATKVVEELREGKTSTEIRGELIWAELREYG